MNEHDVFFYWQSIEEKNQIIYRTCPCRNNRGYKPMFEEKLSLIGDLKGRFDLAMRLLADDNDRTVRSASYHYRRKDSSCSSI